MAYIKPFPVERKNLWPLTPQSSALTTRPPTTSNKHSRIEGLDLPWFQRIEIHTHQYYAQWAKQSDMSYETLTPQLYY